MELLEAFLTVNYGYSINIRRGRKLYSIANAMGRRIVLFDALNVTFSKSSRPEGHDVQPHREDAI